MRNRVAADAPEKANPSRRRFLYVALDKYIMRQRANIEEGRLTTIGDTAHRYDSESLQSHRGRVDVKAVHHSSVSHRRPNEQSVPERSAVDPKPAKLHDTSRFIPTSGCVSTSRCDARLGVI